MKTLLSIFIFLIIFGCTSNKTVYWCGDHQCINKKEKEAYFKKTMIVEVREIKKVNPKEKSKIETMEELAKKNEKKRIMEEKELKKQAKLEEKRKAMEEKELKKQAKNQKNLKKNNKKTSKILNKEKNTDLPNNKIVLKQSSFKKLADDIINRNSLKPYPEINKIPN